MESIFAGVVKLYTL